MVRLLGIPQNKVSESTKCKANKRKVTTQNAKEMDSD